MAMLLLVLVLVLVLRTASPLRSRLKPWSSTSQYAPVSRSTAVAT